MRDNKKKVPALLESLGKLAHAGKLQAAYTECARGRLGNGAGWA